MLFTADVFIFCFLPLTLLVFFILGARGWRRLAIGWLVLASAIFYAWFRSDYLLLLAVLILFNYGCGMALSRAHRAGRPNRAMLVLGLAVNVGVLAYYKYTNFILDNANTLFGAGFALEKIILPIGISFFVFQKIAYLVDAYRGEAEEYNLLDFSLFVMYFPQLIAGPIVHHKELIPQFRNASIFKLSTRDLSAGLVLFTIGLIKKILIADRLIVWSDQLFSAANTGTPALFEAWNGALAFTFQIYFDFSAYSDMALGLALMMGIRLPVNFDSPYKAASIIDFWRRWHITLSRFLRDYVYFPLGGNRQGPARRYVNLMATMLLGGLWHGAAWTFVAWGGLHGFYLMVNHGWRAYKKRRGMTSSPTGRHVWAARIVTFIAVVIAWVFFRAESFGAALRVLEGMAGLNGVQLSIALQAQLPAFANILQHLGVSFEPSMAIWPGLRRAFWFIVLLYVVWGLPNSQTILGHFRPALEILHASRLAAPLRSIAHRLGLTEKDGTFSLSAVTGAIVAAVVIGLSIYQMSQVEPLQKFIYFQF